MLEVCGQLSLPGCPHRGKVVLVVVPEKEIGLEVYERATQTTSWFLLRYTAGLLGKRADSLAKSLADILVLQKQVTVGLPPEPREKVIDAPLSPDQLCDLIQEACGEDSLMTILTQGNNRDQDHLKNILGLTGKSNIYCANLSCFDAVISQ
ncbi:unnamed protein product [Schistosoma mattheei]|uniref:Phosphorylase b kinase regulatory subunit n=1 Tax=Schistosoma mattheei TaxID=31246 RepID=A0A183Q047_9TREM|nr:unnamed protein product [Schistosoma mattheei]